MSGRRSAAGIAGVLRWLIGLVLLATAIGKLLDVPGFARVLATYEAFPEWALTAVAVLVPVAELALAAWLFSGRGAVGAAVAAVALHLIYAVWAALSIRRGLKLVNCGCFGVFFARPLTWGTVVEDLVMAALSSALLILALARKRIA